MDPEHPDGDGAVRRPAGAPPDVVVLVVTWRGRAFIDECLSSLEAQTHPHRVLVLDNDSDDGTAAHLADRWPEVPVVRTETNLGFAGGVAAGTRIVEARYPGIGLLALLNDDAAADPDWLAELVRALDEQPLAAAATSLVLLRDGRVNNAGNVLVDGLYGADRGFGQDPASVGRAEDVFGFSGGAALLRLDAVHAVGGMAAELFLYYEDTDLSWRLRLAGHRIVYVPTAVVRHRHSASSNQASRRFALFNERNRLLVLLRCAPLRTAALQILRFLLVTVSLAGRQALRRTAWPAWQQRPGLRMSVLLQVVRQLPATLRARRTISRAARLSRAEVLRRWAPGGSGDAGAGIRACG